MMKTATPITTDTAHTVIVRTMAENLQRLGMKAAGLHIDLPQPQERGLPQLLKKAAPQAKPLTPSKLHA